MLENLTPGASDARCIKTDPNEAAVAFESQKSLLSLAAAPRRPDLMRIERAIDLRRLRYFVSIVAEGSFSAAAERLRVAQPALSHHVRELETVLGVALLTRSVHGVTATDAGRCLYEHGLKILSKVGEAAAEVSAFNIGTLPKVRIGLDGAAAAMLSAPLVEALQMRNVRFLLTLTEVSSCDICKLIEGRRLDLGLVFDAQESKSLVLETLLTDELYLIGPPGDAEDDVSFREAVGLPLILPPAGNPLRERLERAAKSAKLALDVVVESDGMSSAKKLVRAGVGRSVMPAAEVDDEHSLGLLQRRAIVDPSLAQTLSLCMPRDGKVSREALFVRSVIPGIVEEARARTERPRGLPIFARSRRPSAVAFA
jgi:LysR family transcriptional regulator, nitrogen assimilation regulatory protein